MDFLKIIYRGFNKKNKVYVFNDRIINNPVILSILRVRDEELIIQDTLDHLSSFCNAIVCYDDDSNDNTFRILKNHKRVIAIIRNLKWLSKPEERIQEETNHRLSLLNLAKTFRPKWIFCADADERYIGNIRDFVESNIFSDIDIVRISLFDAYMTENDKAPFIKGEKLMNFRKYFGPERRDIIMLWKPHDDITFVGLDSREPVYSSDRNVVTKFNCQHYGKSLSVEHWEETCDYYVKHFPYESYGKKWQERKGNAIHNKSDFNRPLFEWGEKLFSNATVIHPGEIK